MASPLVSRGLSLANVCANTCHHHRPAMIPRGYELITFQADFPEMDIVTVLSREFALDDYWKSHGLWRKRADIELAGRALATGTFLSSDARCDTAR